MLYHKCKVIRDVNTVYNRAVPSWELPVLTFIFDDGNVQPTDIFEIVDRPYPDAGVEFDRLIRRYGSDVKSGVPFAVSVFGAGQLGIREVNRIMEEAKADEAERREAGTLPKRRYALVPKHLAERDELLA